MKNLGKLVIVYILSVGWAFGASVKATVDTVEVFKSNPVTLRIKATGGNTVFPKITTVADAPVISISKSTSRNFSIVNGNIDSEKSVILAIQFVPEHNMTIPAFTVNIDGREYQTDPIDIKVVTSQEASSQGTDLFSLQMQANKTKVMEGESLLLTVYYSLHDSIRLSREAQFTPPRFSDFTAINIAEQNVYKQGNNKIQEIRYILTAQKKGNFNIAPARIRIGLPDTSRRDIYGLNLGTKWVQAVSNSLHIEVIPQTQESDILGDFSVEATIDAQEVKANKPVNFTVKIEGKGNLEGFEFPKYDIDGVMVYSDEAKVDTKVVDGALYSIYSKNFVFISDRDFVIPERSFSMLTLKDKSLKQLTVPSYSITIKQNAHAVASAGDSSKKSGIQSTIPKTKAEVKKQAGSQTVAWWMLLIAFALGVLSMYLVQLLPHLKARKTNPYKEAEALKILYAHIGEDEKIEAMVHKLYARKNGDKSVQIDKKELKEMVERFR